MYLKQIQPKKIFETLDKVNQKTYLPSMQLLSLDDKVNSENEVKHTSYGLYGTHQEDCILKWLKVKTKDFKFKSKSNEGL